MKILLLNDNPVVNKLVTLSAQKTSDELEVVNSVDEIEIGEYDLLVVDDARFQKDLLAQIKEKIDFNSSLYICSRDAQPAEGFTATLKKPFLPTDLVELFSTFGKESRSSHLSENIHEEESEILDLHDAQEEEEDLLADTLEEDTDMPFDDDFNLNLEEELSGELNGLEDLEELEDDLEDDLGNFNFEEELVLDTLDNELLLDDSDAAAKESVLDKDELQEVQNLLEDEEDDFDDNLDEELSPALTTQNDDFDIEKELSATMTTHEDDFDFENELSATLTTQEDDFDFENELSEELEDELEQSFTAPLTTQDDDFDFETELSPDVSDPLINDLDESDELIDEAVEEDIEEAFTADLEEQDDEELDFEEQISSAVGELSKEDLEGEVDENTLLDIALHEIGGIDSLTERDLKLAIGEEVEPEQEELEEDIQISQGAFVEKAAPKYNEDEGVASLKRLLEALSNEGVAASLKGMKVSINITFGDQ